MALALHRVIENTREKRHVAKGENRLAVTVGCTTSVPRPRFGQSVVCWSRGGLAASPENRPDEMRRSMP